MSLTLLDAYGGRIILRWFLKK